MATFLHHYLCCLVLCVASFPLGTAAAKIAYVDDDASVSGDGTSWATAYRFLQDALSDAAAAEEAVEIHVAGGIYRPDRGSDQIAGDSQATFSLATGVSLQGGYAGLDGVDPNARDVGLYESILSGDLAGNDVPLNDPCDLMNEASRTDNSYHVVTVLDAEPNTVIDGFTITAGHAKPFSPDIQIPYAPNGGGMYVASADLVVVNCRFTWNLAGNGGALYAVESRLDLANCLFGNNFAQEVCVVSEGGRDGLAFCWHGDGGAVFTGGGSSKIRNCLFTGNGAKSGGAIHESGEVQEMQNCLFVWNDADWGGGLYCTQQSSSKALRCTFRGNTASDYGGGMANKSEADIELVDCAFFDNRSGWKGGGMANFSAKVLCVGSVFSRNCAERAGGAILSSESTAQLFGCLVSGSTNSAVCTTAGDVLTIGNCTVVDNTGGQASGFALYGTAEAPSTLHMVNSILRNDGNEILNGNESTVITISYSNITGSWPGDGNIDVDPCFVRVVSWNPNGTPGDPNDDFFVEGDYHLKSQAGRWDPASGSWVQDEVTSPCIDAGDPNTPIMYEPFPNGGIINMGAYGGTAEASKSYFGGPVCGTIITGDINGDCRVDLADILLLLNNWLRDETAR